MRHFCLILLLAGLITPACHAATVTLSWDLNDPSPDGYRVFARLDGSTYDYSAPDWEGPAPPAVLTVEDGAVWFFVARAYLTNCGDPPEPCESADSNEVSYDAIVIVPPINPLATQGFTVTWTEEITGNLTQYECVTLPDTSILCVPR